MKKQAVKNVENLLRGISTDHVETVRDAWRALLEEPEDSVQIVRAKLASSAWIENPRGPLAKYFGVLLSILDEMDSLAFEHEITRLRSSKLHPAHKKTLEVLSQRVLDKPVFEVAGRIPVYIASDITDQKIVLGNIQRWSRTKGLILDKVTRIDVIADRPELDYLGKYNLFFSGIVLTWPAFRVVGLRLWCQRLIAEFTFYHEVGHHVSGHVEGGQVVEQEKEADEYARAMMRSSRPVFTYLGRAMFWLFKPILTVLIRSGGRTKNQRN